MVAEEDGDPVSTAVRNIAQTLRKAGAKVTANVTLKAGGSDE
jgi:hypothetical protein